MSASLKETAFHPLTELFPLMEGEEFEALCRDIQENGLQEKIWLHPDGRIIDGRNRYRACRHVGVEPEYQTWSGANSLVGFVVSMNLHRRHLDKGQRAAIAVKTIMPALEEEANHRKAHGKTAPGKTLSQKIDQALETQEGRAAAQAARIVQTNRQYISDAKKLSKEAPDLLDSVIEGKKTLVQARRALIEKNREARREENREKVKSAPALTDTIDARFATIAIDPPWVYKDDDDGNLLGRAMPPYSLMSVDDIQALPLEQYADVDCHLYLWITNWSLPRGFGLLEKWGFRYVTTLTWCKPHFGMGNYFRGSTEHILFGVKGSQPLKRKDIGTWFQAPRGPNGHSSKPVEFYELVESCSPGPYLEIFARSERPDWTTWGAEVTSQVGHDGNPTDEQ